MAEAEFEVSGFTRVGEGNYRADKGKSTITQSSEKHLIKMQF
jgi:hypothetical protein